MKLIAHPAAPALTLQIEAGAHWRGDALGLQFRLSPATELKLAPPSSAPAFRDELWRHTCCELFIAAADAPDAYREFNFSPSGDWAAYAFGAYRAREAWQPATAPTIRSHLADHTLVLDVTLPLTLLPPAAAWQAGLSVVAETTANALSWWALHHAAAQPDFHQRAAMCLRLDRPDSF